MPETNMTGTNMPGSNRVYHIHYEAGRLPDEDAEKAKFGRDTAQQITGLPKKSFTALMQGNPSTGACRLTIAVDAADAESCRKLEQHGAQLSHTEPATAFINGDSCVMPSTFQLLRLGTLLEPQSLSNNPERQMRLANILAITVKGFPENARDFMTWQEIESDEQTGTVVLRWTSPKRPGPDVRGGQRP